MGAESWGFGYRQNKPRARKALLSPLGTRVTYRCSAVLDLQEPLRLQDISVTGGAMTDDEFVTAYRRLNDAGKARLKAILDVGPIVAPQQLPAGTQAPHEKAAAAGLLLR
jgi:hypothetical protein